MKLLKRFKEWLEWLGTPTGDPGCVPQMQPFSPHFDFIGEHPRDQLARTNPVPHKYALKIWGSSSAPTTDSERAAFFAVWALLNYEYAEAMNNEGKRRTKESFERVEERIRSSWAQK